MTVLPAILAVVSTGWTSLSGFTNVTPRASAVIHRFRWTTLSETTNGNHVTWTAVDPSGFTQTVTRTISTSSASAPRRSLGRGTRVGAVTNEVDGTRIELSTYVGEAGTTTVSRVVLSPQEMRARALERRRRRKMSDPERAFRRFVSPGGKVEFQKDVRPVPFDKVEKDRRYRPPRGGRREK